MKLTIEEAYENGMLAFRETCVENSYLPILPLAAVAHEVKVPLELLRRRRRNPFVGWFIFWRFPRTTFDIESFQSLDPKAKEFVASVYDGIETTYPDNWDVDREILNGKLAMIGSMIDTRGLSEIKEYHPVYRDELFPALTGLVNQARRCFRALHEVSTSEWRSWKPFEPPPGTSLSLMDAYRHGADLFRRRIDEGCWHVILPLIRMSVDIRDEFFEKESFEKRVAFLKSLFFQWHFARADRFDPETISPRAMKELEAFFEPLKDGDPSGKTADFAVISQGLRPTVSRMVEVELEIPGKFQIYQMNGSWIFHSFRVIDTALYFMKKSNPHAPFLDAYHIYQELYKEIYKGYGDTTSMS